MCQEETWKHAVAARIERGYLKRTAGSTACINNHVYSRGTGTDGSSHSAAERTSTTARDGGDDTRTRKKLAQQVQSMTGTPARTARAGRSGGHLGKESQTSSTEIHQQELTTTETISTPGLNATLGSAFSTQMYYMLVMTTRAALDKCHNAGVNEGFEARRQFVMEWESKLRTRCVGLLMNVLVHRFRDDIPNKLAGSREACTTARTSPKTVDDDIKIGVTMQGMEDVRVKEHHIRNSVRITSWNKMRANPKGKNSKGKDVKGNDKAKDAKNQSFKKAKSDE